ncbi:hypothetical protein ACWPOB_07100 [Rhodococcus sp. 2H158]
MRRGTWGDDVEKLHALSVNGVIRTATLLRRGMSSSTISGRCRKDGPWQRVLPGVVALHNGPLTQLHRQTAAQMYGGDEAVISGHAALGLHGYALSSTRSEILLLIPQNRHRRNFSFVTVERSWRVPEPVHKGTLRIAPVARSLLDAGRRTSRADACRGLFSAAIQRGDVTVDQLAHELAEGSCRGTAIPRTVIRELFDDAHSVAEIEAQKVYGGSDLPPMVHNRDIETSNGTWIARPDGWIDSVAVAWEIDSLAHHLGVQEHEATMRRRANMQRHGIIVVTHLPRQIRTEPATVLADLTAACRQGLERPRPDVRVR